MTDQPTNITFINKPNYFAWAVALAAIIAIVIVLSKCHGTATQYAEVVRQNDSLTQDKIRTQQEKTRDSIILTAKINATAIDRDHHAHGEDSIKTVLNTLQKNNKGLPGRILEYVNITDTAFQHKCDSAARALLAASKSYDDLKMEDEQRRILDSVEMALRTQYAAEVQKYLDSCNAQSYRQSELFNKAMSIGKPRPSLWLGAEGTNSIYYTSFGAVVAFQFKNGSTQVSLSAGPVLKGGTYGQVRVIQKIKLHK